MDVLAFVRAAEGQNQGLFRVQEKAVELLKQFGLGIQSVFAALGLRQHVVVVGVEFFDVDPRWEDPEIGQLPVLVHPVLLANLLVGAGDD